jgi:prepilin-type N-terminal cleavage/methylation domain-containing protein
MRDNRGFTLLEAMIALVLLGVALVPLMRSVGVGVREQGRLRAHLDAVSLAEARMSELSLLHPDSIGAYMRPREGVFPEPFGAYRWSAVLRPEGRTPALLRAAVLVRWKEGTYSLETVLHRTDLLPEFAPPQ